MDSRRVPRTVIDPKVRQVGFFAPGGPPTRSHSTPPDPSSSSPPVSDLSPSGNTLSPVMIPPPRHLSDLSRQVPCAMLAGVPSVVPPPASLYPPAATTPPNSPPLRRRLEKSQRTHRHRDFLTEAILENSLPRSLVAASISQLPRPIIFRRVV
ncbi:hypothetical protein TEA_019403 [Camellia sinensis var. sinensis]|uniref:Uncharacterized protein n=1 Tax=Camellia sinensis var. sinensis TaxID=542762 RepID=A0A4S4DU52_CAMSN|nr:hypothetical protein TEA_019403 [Camellia sinensis var. sinensis]